MDEIRLDIAEIKYSPPEEVQQKIKSSVSELNRYPSGGYNELKEEYSGFLEVEPEQICFSNGLDEMIDLITDLWGGRNFVPTPTFSQFAEAAERRDQKALEISMMEEEGYEIDLERIDYTADIIWICSPNNPTGTEVELEKIPEICEKASGIVAVDECYAEFSDSRSSVGLIDEYSNLIVLRSFSKSFGLAGIRLGAAISSQANIERIDEFRQPFNVNRIAATAGKEALRNKETYAEMRDKIIQTGERFSQFLENLGFKTGEVNGNFVLADFQDEERARRYYRTLQRLNVSVFPGWDEEFTGLDARFLRFSIGTQEQMKEVENRFKNSERNRD